MLKRLITVIVVLVLVLFLALQPKIKEAPGHSVVFYTYRDGPRIETIYLESNGRITKPADPTRASAEFLGWFTSRGYEENTEFDFDSRINKSITLYAKWHLFVYTIIYDLGDGAWPSEEIMNEYQFEIDVENPTLYFPSTGNTRKAPIHPNGSKNRFSGWYTISQEDYKALTPEEREAYPVITKIESKGELDKIFDSESRTLVLYAHYRNL